jgi:Bardet-Biedl syndrome 1 protein
LADVFGDGDCKLVCAHYSTNKSELKLKVFKGASLIKESNLVDTPTALISLFMDNLQPRVPAIAVASGSSIYIYKNLRPSFQFTLPPIDVNDVERDIWAKAKEVKQIVTRVSSCFNNHIRENVLSLGSYRSDRNA